MLKRLLLTTALVAATTIARADTVTIQLGENGGPLTTYSNVPVTGLFGVPSPDLGWTVYAREAGGAFPGTQGFEINVFNQVPGSLQVIITSQNNVAPVGLQDFAAEFRSLVLFPYDWTAVEQLWFDPNNGVGLSGYPLSQVHVFQGGSADSALEQFPLNYGSGPYSMTAYFSISGPSCCGQAYTDINTNSTNNLAPVPGPVVGAGVPGLVVALLGWLGWRRRAPRPALIATLP